MRRGWAEVEILGGQGWKTGFEASLGYRETPPQLKCKKRREGGERAAR